MWQTERESGRRERKNTEERERKGSGPSKENMRWGSFSDEKESEVPVLCSNRWMNARGLHNQFQGQWFAEINREILMSRLQLPEAGVRSRAQEAAGQHGLTIYLRKEGPGGRKK